MHIFVKVNAGLLTLLYVATKVMQDEMIKNVSNIEKYQPVSLGPFTVRPFASEFFSF